MPSTSYTFFTVKKHPSFSIILPTCNEADNLPLLLDRFYILFKTRKLNGEIILVDDHSTDTTLILAKKYEKKLPLTIIPSTVQKGKSNALLLGIRSVHTQYIVTIDADNQYHPKSIIPLLSCVKKGADLAIAHRRYKNGSPIRILASRCLSYFLCSFLVPLHVDALGGLKVFRRSISKNWTHPLTPWSFDLELTWKAHCRGCEIQQIVVPVYARTKGESKLQPLQDTISLIATALKLRFTTRE
ncbi:hypothetical protein C5B42_03920 [Candidatus Cerribacteria bacterium 'Amazon FNV 2010 28 9']|uniref:Glycosyltransferase 2-like domain-containing protein n=1 Tax=Candidatus Cerribacteria bacterium 'Amazon FNV 2010 28 9' TaxID=2081795 RepID=A0A317JNR6_9BACT|nr:MAG: hypothetical protein C5B42_03920 [Candidatus Cerribacteria bacterium 'Amazon FNV 2010 28 9']